MVMGFSQVRIGSFAGTGTATLLVSGDPDSSSTTLLVNTDPINTVWLSDSNSFTAGDTDNSSPLPPNSTIVLDGTITVFAACVSGRTAMVSVHPTASSFFQPITVFSGPVYDYNGTPQTGNLVATFGIKSDGVDQFNNPVVRGIASYSSSSIYVSLTDGGINFYHSVGGPPSLQGTINTISPNKIGFTLASIESIDGNSFNTTLISTDTWTDVSSFGTGFQAGSPVPQYAIMPHGVGGKNSVQIRGQVICNAGVAVGAVMFTLPFLAGRVYDFVTPNNLSGAALGQRIVRVTTSGDVQVRATGVSPNFVILDGIEYSQT